MRLARRLLLILPFALAIAITLSLDAAHLKPRPHGEKPMFPVLAKLETIAAPKPGGVATIIARVAAWIPGEELAWRLEVPAGISVVSGPTSWSGELQRGETRTFEIRVVVPDGAPHELTAVLNSRERPHVRSAATLRLDLGGFDGPRGTETIVSEDGVDYIQYRGTVIPR